MDEFDVLDPHPDVHVLFVLYNRLYFDDVLGAASVQWSSQRMTRCAGTCSFQKGGGCVITLSEPLLKFRPSLELKETLLHEMIHAYIFLKGIRDGDHGPRFRALMKHINEASFPDPQRPAGGYNITVYHSMHEEVENYQRHHWKCDRCENVVKRAMNRPPQEADCRGRMGKGSDCKDPKCNFHMHIRHCGGQYVKVAEPEGYSDKRKKKQEEKPKFAGAPQVPLKRPRSNAAAGSAHITDFFSRITEPECEGKEGWEAPSACTAASVGAAQAQKPTGAALVNGARGMGAADTAEQRRLLLAQAAQRRMMQDSSWLDSSKLESRTTFGQLSGSGAVRATHSSQGEQLRVNGLSTGHVKPELSHEQIAQTACARSGASEPAPGVLGGDRRFTGAAKQDKPQRDKGLPAVDEDVCIIGDVEDDCSKDTRAASWPDGSFQAAGRVPTDVTLIPDNRHQNAKQAERAAGGPTAPLSGLQSTEILVCPCCGRQWREQEISNDKLNQHVDECLNALAVC